MAESHRPSVVYLTRTGLLEPLGRSQVFAYLEELAKNFRIVLVTCERIADRSDTDRMAAARRGCEAAGIDWRPMPFEQGPRPLAILRQTLRFIREVNKERSKGPVLAHARSYLPALAALYANRRHAVPFVFDKRALWAEELIMAGRLKRGSIAHRFLVWLERQCLRNGTTVSLTQAAADYLYEQYPAETAGKVIHVIPICADLQRFVPGALSEGPPIFGCNGTVLSGWFRLDFLATRFCSLQKATPTSRPHVMARENIEPEVL